MNEITFEKGVVRLTKFSHISDDVDSEKLIVCETNLVLDWESYHELGQDHGHIICAGILEDRGFGLLSESRLSEVYSEIRHKISNVSLELIQHRLSAFDKESEPAFLKEVFIVALWAEIFEEPYSVFWLAAMAQHALYIRRNEYAFGYFAGLLDQRSHNEEHLLRGKHTLKSASDGGLARASKLRPQTSQTLREMKRLIEAGQSLSRAAALSHINGHGESDAANRKLWYRHQKK